MAVLSIILFFLFFILIYIFRKLLLENVIPKIFNLSFLLVAFVLAGIIFSIIYASIDFFVSNKVFKEDFYNGDIANRTLDYLYFSFISQLTIGYGDISPIHPLGKLFSMIQGIIGAIFMGGLIASLLEFSKTVLNYLYVSEISFFHCDATSNHNSEIFNMDLNIVKSRSSVFTDFRVLLLAEHSDGRQFQVLGSQNDSININNKISIDISQKNKYPQFINNSGKLAYETFNPIPTSMTSKEMVGEPTIFDFEKLYLKYTYCFESKIHTKELEIRDKDRLASLLNLSGRNKSNIEKYNKH